MSGLISGRLVALGGTKTVDHPFGTIKRMSGGGRFLTRGLRAVKAEAALSILAFNILHAVNAFGAKRATPAG
jgi:hypothetical protein